MKKILLRNADCYESFRSSDLSLRFDSSFNAELQVYRGINDHGKPEYDNIKIRPESLFVLIGYLQCNYDLYKQSLQFEASNVEPEKSD